VGRIFLPLLLITESPLAPYVGGYQNRNQYELAPRFMGVLYFDLLSRTTDSFHPCFPSRNSWAGKPSGSN